MFNFALLTTQGGEVALANYANLWRILQTLFALFYSCNVNTGLCTPSIKQLWLVCTFHQAPSDMLPTQSTHSLQQLVLTICLCTPPSQEHMAMHTCSSDEHILGSFCTVVVHLHHTKYLPLHGSWLVHKSCTCIKLAAAFFHSELLPSTV